MENSNRQHSVVFEVRISLMFTLHPPDVIHGTTPPFLLLFCFLWQLMGQPENETITPLLDCLVSLVLRLLVGKDYQEPGYKVI